MSNESDMKIPKVVSREEWLRARKELLKAEKELTRRNDELTRQRRGASVWVRIEKDYRFETDKGNVLLKDLFRGRSQLLMYHFMFGPEYLAVARIAHRLPTASTATSCVWPITT